MVQHIKVNHKQFLIFNQYYMYYLIQNQPF